MKTKSEKELIKQKKRMFSFHGLKPSAHVLTDASKNGIVSFRHPDKGLIGTYINKKKLILIEGEKFARQCSECKDGMDEGYVIQGGEEYYCSEKCLHKHYTKKDWKAIYNNGESDSMWTDWEMPFDAQYIVKGGKLMEIEEEPKKIMCKKYPKDEVPPDENGKCSLCGGDCTNEAKRPLFTTEDGVKMYEGDQYYAVDPKTGKFVWSVADSESVKTGWKKYSVDYVIRHAKVPELLNPLSMYSTEREIGFVASIIHESYFEELRKQEGVMWAHEQIANASPTIAKETIAVPKDEWEERKEDFESYVVRRARELFATIDIVVEL